MSIKRSAGILLPIFSLPSNYGIGTLGRESYRFIDFLHRAKQTYWQILPLGPTSYGDSPYASFSSFAGNPYFIDLDLLIRDGLLKRSDVKHLEPADPMHVDYGNIYRTRFEVLRKAYRRGYERDRQQLDEFVERNRSWLVDYALYMAVKNHFGMVSWLDWPDEEIRLRKPGAVERYLEMLGDDVRFYEYLQYLFFRQFNDLKNYAHSKGIKIIGDLPIYVALDSADVWASPIYFQLDEVNVPKEVAGVPPDYFSEDGQLWGNPLYDWDRLKQDGYKWWLDRVAGAGRYYDVLRIDHFRGFESYWAVPYGEKTARIGRWIKGPNMDFIRVMLDSFPDIEFIAEDLGILSDDVDRMLLESGLPGMRVVEFGMAPGYICANTPHMHKPNSICYVGTHDNSTLLGWKKSVDRREVNNCKRYFAITDKSDEAFNFGVISGCMASVANLFVAQMQDYLLLDDCGRINSPGTLGNNWTWRLLKGQYDRKLADRIAKMTEVFGRN